MELHNVLLGRKVANPKTAKEPKGSTRVDWELMLNAGQKADIPLRVIGAAAKCISERGTTN